MTDEKMDLLVTMVEENHQIIHSIQRMIQQQQRMINNLEQRLDILEKRLDYLEFGDSVDTEDFQKIVRNQDELRKLLDKLNL